MWVEVLEAPGSGTFAGQLLNEPRELNGLERGDRLTFGPEHVAAINYSAEELGYDPGLFLGVSPRVAAEDRSPALLLFQSSTDPAYSGWYTFTGEEGEHERSPAGLTVWSLGYLTDRFPEVAAVFREGGSAWTWDACAGTYRPLESSEVR